MQAEGLTRTTGGVDCACQVVVVPAPGVRWPSWNLASSTLLSVSTVSSGTATRTSSRARSTNLAVTFLSSFMVCRQKPPVAGAGSAGRSTDSPRKSLTGGSVACPSLGKHVLFRDVHPDRSRTPHLHSQKGGPCTGPMDEYTCLQVLATSGYNRTQRSKREEGDLEEKASRFGQV